MAPGGLKDIKEELCKRREELLRDYGVKEIGIFGSWVRGDANLESDVDILVEFNRSIGFFKFLELEEKIVDWIGAKVDLVTRGVIKPRIGRRILNEVDML